MHHDKWRCHRSGRTNEQTTSKYRATQLLIHEPLSFAISTKNQGAFLEYTVGIPPPSPSKCEEKKLFTSLLQPTFQEGTGSYVSGGPYGPEGEGEGGGSPRFILGKTRNQNFNQISEFQPHFGNLTKFQNFNQISKF